MSTACNESCKKGNGHFRKHVNDLVAGNCILLLSNQSGNELSVRHKTSNDVKANARLRERSLFTGGGGGKV